MTFPTWRRPLAAFFFGIVACLAAAAAHADPPYRVARLAYESGSVSFSPAGEEEWSRAVINRPLITGDRLWVDAGSRAELQIDGGAFRIGDQTSLVLLNVDNRIVQTQLTQGDVELRVWRLDPGQRIEVDTPNLAAVIDRPGAYRIGVDEKYGSTQVTVRAGDVTLYGEGNAFRISPGDTWEFYDTALRDYDNYQPSAPDDLQRFALSRDRRWEQSVSARYVSRELIGFQELDDNGSWRQVPDYGWVWFPTRVSAGWAPYREGHWAWVDPWGWTWVDNEPWGFAPSHYGRWAFVESRWCWVPGPRNDRPVYAPALVAFIGGGAGAIGWFPLGPREVYRPAYQVSREYFTQVNVSNTVVNVTQVNNFYQRRDEHEMRDVHYTNQQVPGAVVAVAAAAFTQAKPVASAAVHFQTQNVAAQPVMLAPPVAPAKQSVLGPQPAQRKPPEHVFTKQVVAQTPPPAPPAPIESKLPALRAQPGQPIAAASAPSRAAAPAAPAAPAPAVKVVPAIKPAAAPPPQAPAANRAEHERRGPPESRPGVFGSPAAPAAAASANPPPANATTSPKAPPPVSAPPAPHGAQPFRPPPAAASSQAPAGPVAPPAAAPTPAPAAAPVPGRPASPAVEQQQRGEEERARRDERQRERPPLAPPGRSAPAAPPAAAPAPAAAPTPAAPPAPAPQAAPPARPAPPAQEEQRPPRREERREPPPAQREAPPPAQRPAPPPQAAQPPQPPHPAPAPQAAPPAQPPAAPPSAHPAPQRPEPRADQRGDPRAEQRAEQRREAASEARHERKP